MYQRTPQTSSCKPASCSNRNISCSAILDDEPHQNSPDRQALHSEASGVTAQSSLTMQDRLVASTFLYPSNHRLGLLRELVHDSIGPIDANVSDCVVAWLDDFACYGNADCGVL
jgi:hypothetical protein